MTTSREEIKAYAAMTLSTLIIGLSFIFVRTALSSATVYDLLAHRFTVAILALAITYIAGRKPIPLFSASRIKPLLLLSLFYPFLFFSLQTLGLKYTTASEAGIISAVLPIITLVMAYIFLKEKTNAKQIISILVSVAGLLYIIFKKTPSSGTGSLKGSLLILLSILSIVAYYILGRKITPRYQALDITFFMTLTAFIVFNCISLYKHMQSDSLEVYFQPFANSKYLWAIVYLGILSSFLTSLFSNYALSVISTSQVGVFNNISPVISVIGGVLFLNENLYLYHIIGSILILLGVAGSMIFKNPDSSNKL